MFSEPQELQLAVESCTRAVDVHAIEEQDSACIRAGAVPITSNVTRRSRVSPTARTMEHGTMCSPREIVRANEETSVHVARTEVSSTAIRDQGD